MKKIYFLLIMSVVSVTCFQCNSKIKSFRSYSIIRNNFFSDNYSLPQKDTNKVNEHLYSAIFDKVRFENGARCLLVKIYSSSIIWQEYGLYDYKNEKFYYTSSSNKSLYQFEEVNNGDSVKLYNVIKTFIENYDLLQKKIQQNSNLYDGNNFEVSLIQIDSNMKLVSVESYYW